MKKVVKWIAEDGTKFDNEDECYYYEREIKAKKIENEFLMLDFDGQPVKNPFGDFDKVGYIFVKTYDAGDFLYEELAQNYCTPWDDYESRTGAWFYEGESDRWISLQEVTNWLEDFKKYTPNWFADREL